MSHVIVRLADLLAARRRSPATVCRWATGDGALYGRLCNGRGVTSRRAGQIVRWFSSQWPDDLAWPADIPPRRAARARLLRGRSCGPPRVVRGFTECRRGR